MGDASPQTRVILAQASIHPCFHRDRWTSWPVIRMDPGLRRGDTVSGAGEKPIAGAHQQSPFTDDLRKNRRFVHTRRKELLGDLPRSRWGDLVMLDYAYYHAAELLAFGALVLVIFAIARMAEASPPLALVVAVVPAAAAWYFYTHGLSSF